MENLTEIFTDILADAAVDTLKLIPFLFLTYFAMELLEHKTGERIQAAVRKAGVAGPAIGAVLGVVPQCGFSAAAATLYAGRVVTLGTLFAVFLSTSDEMLPIFIANQAPLGTIFGILLTKLIIGMIAGFAVDGVLHLHHTAAEPLRIHELCEREHCDCHHDCAECEHHPEEVYHHHDDCAEGCNHEHHQHNHEHDAGWGHIIKSAAIHTVEVTVFIFLLSFVLGVLIEFVGQDALAAFIGSNQILSIILSGVVGLIPNCAASVVIAQLYIEGLLGAGAMMSGLLVSAGVGVLILLRANRPAKSSIGIIAGLLAFGIFFGLVISLLGITF